MSFFCTLIFFKETTNIYEPEFFVSSTPVVVFNLFNPFFINARQISFILMSHTLILLRSLFTLFMLHRIKVDEGKHEL